MISSQWQEIPRQQKIILIVVLIGLGLTILNIAVSPVLKHFDQSKQEISDIQLKLENLSAAELDLNSSSVEKYEAERNALNSLLPEKINALTLLRMSILNYERANHDIEFVLLEPLDVEQGEMSEKEDGSAIYGPGLIPIRIKINSTFDDMVQYFNYLESQNWILSARTLDIKRHNNHSGKLSIDAVFTLALKMTDNKSQREMKTSSQFLVNNTNKIVHVDRVEVKDIAFTTLSREVTVQRKKSTKKNRRNIEKPKYKQKPNFKVDGLWQNGVIVNGDLYNLNEKVQGWIVEKVDLLQNEVEFTKNQFSATIKVEQ